MKRLVYKDFYKDPHHQKWVKELRSFLPKNFDGVSDDELILAYERFSEDHYCAGWLMPDEYHAAEFVESVVVVRSYSDVLVGFLLGSLAAVLAYSVYILT